MSFSEEIKSYDVSAGAHSGVGCFTKCDFSPSRCLKGPKKYAALILALICCRVHRVLSICVFSGYSGESFYKFFGHFHETPCSAGYKIMI